MHNNNNVCVTCSQRNLCRKRPPRAVESPADPPHLSLPARILAADCSSAFDSHGNVRVFRGTSPYVTVPSTFKHLAASFTLTSTESAPKVGDDTPNGPIVAHGVRPRASLRCFPCVFWPSSTSVAVRRALFLRPWHTCYYTIYNSHAHL